MQDIIALERRINIALDRIASQMARRHSDVRASEVAQEPDVHQNEELIEARMINAQLQEMLRVQKEKEESGREDVLALTARLEAALVAREAECKDLRRTMEKLIQTVDVLQGNLQAEGRVDPELHEVLLSELGAVKALRAADERDLASVIADLDSVLKDSENHA